MQIINCHGSIVSRNKNFCSIGITDITKRPVWTGSRVVFTGLLEHTYKEFADTQEKKVRYWYQNSLRLNITYKEWVNIQPEKKGHPSKWVTLRALRVLKAAYPAYYG